MNATTQASMQLVGRVLLGVLFLVAGIRKTMGFAASVAYMTKAGLPMADQLLVLAVILEIGGGLLLILGWKTRWVAIALLIFVAIVTPIFHAFWTFEPPQLANQLNHMLKNLAIIGGLLYVVVHGAGAFSVDARSTRLSPLPSGA
jgi:putative oxidoreductase